MQRQCNNVADSNKNSRPLRHSGKSGCRVCTGPCPDTRAAPRRGNGSDSAPSDTCGWLEEGSSPTLPVAEQQKDKKEVEIGKERDTNWVQNNQTHSLLNDLYERKGIITGLYFSIATENKVYTASLTVFRTNEHNATRLLMLFISLACHYWNTEMSVFHVEIMFWGVNRCLEPYLRITIQKSDWLVCDLEEHLLGPDFVFWVQKNQFLDCIIHCGDGLCLVHNKCGKMLQRKQLLVT